MKEQIKVENSKRAKEQIKLENSKRAKEKRKVENSKRTKEQRKVENSKRKRSRKKDIAGIEYDPASPFPPTKEQVGLCGQLLSVI